MISNYIALKKFCENWYGIILNEASFERKDYPKKLSEYYSIFYDLFSEGHEFTNLNSGQDLIVSPTESSINDGQIEIVIENQSCWVCLVEGQEDNPFVLSNAMAEMGEATGLESVECRLNDVLITITLQEIVMTSPNLININDNKLNLKDAIVTDLNHMWGPSRVAYNEDTHNFWCDEKQTLIVMEYGGLWLCGKSKSPAEFLKTEIEFTSME